MLKKHKMKKQLIFGIFLILYISSISSAMQISNNKASNKNSFLIDLNKGKTIYVDNNNTEGPWDGTIEQPYKNIQDGIDNANNGDNVFVFNGFYIENVNVNKSIDIIGEDNHQTVIKRNQSGATVKITTGFVNISNLKITNSNADLGGITIFGIKQPVLIQNNILYQNNHGIYLDNCNENVTIENNTIDCCNSDWSRGIYCLSGKPIIQYNNISQCGWGITFSSGSKGKALHNNIFDNICYGIMSIASKPYIANNTIFHNEQGINSRCQDYAIIENNIIYENSDYGIMFGLVGGQPSCHPKISNNIIISNGYGIDCHDGTNSVIKNNTIAYNNYRGINCFNSNPTIIDNYIIDNGATGIHYTYGGGLVKHNYITEHDSHGIYIRLVEPTILNNTISSNKIGIYIDTETPTINYNNIMGNNEYGVYFRDYLGTVNAKYNWWNSADGPSGNGPGSGDKIGDESISYKPWRTEENQNAYPRTIIGNSPPDKPSKPDGPTDGFCHELYYYSTIASTPFEHLIKYGWDSDGDSKVDYWTLYYGSGEKISTIILWFYEGVYELRVKAVDLYGKSSEWSDPLMVTMKNHIPPNKPTINGPRNGKAGIEYEYTFNSIDPEGDNISYCINWGDGSGWNYFGPYSSGEEITLRHKWSISLIYMIRAFVEDEHGYNSDRARFMVSMPRSKISTNPFFFGFSKQLPLLQKILIYFLKFDYECRID